MTTVTPAPRELTSEQVAARVPCSLPTLYRLAAAGLGPPSYMVGRFRRYDAAEVERWLADRKRFIK
jgi:excisionase family DNA binding protein